MHNKTAVGASSERPPKVVHHFASDSPGPATHRPLTHPPTSTPADHRGMARRGTAQVKPATARNKAAFPRPAAAIAGPGHSESNQGEKHGPVPKPTLVDARDHSEALREQPNLGTPLRPEHGCQPRQASATFKQSNTLVKPLFPPGPLNNQSAARSRLHRPTPTPVEETEPLRVVAANTAPARHTQHLVLLPPQHSRRRQSHEQSLQDTKTMALPGGASIPANQQRNMRACMVCSIVRTQQQFMTAGCPNCEDILELAGNSEQVNDCTSQVFEGLISVSDTKRSWVARYQRLEGYVPGVYATQVEGILPEDIIVAVENAGINYVPRDGSEQEMLPKD